MAFLGYSIFLPRLCARRIAATRQIPFIALSRLAYPTLLPALHLSTKAINAAKMDSEIMDDSVFNVDDDSDGFMPDDVIIPKVSMYMLVRTTGCPLLATKSCSSLAAHFVIHAFVVEFGDLLLCTVILPLDFNSAILNPAQTQIESPFQNQDACIASWPRLRNSFRDIT